MLTLDDQQAIITAATLASPEEMCGLLFREGGFYQAKNVAEQPEHTFEIAHSEFLRAMAQYGSYPWAIVHSHPRSWDWPSGEDGRLMDALLATGHTIAMVIVGLKPMIFKKGPCLALYEVVNGVYENTWRVEL